MPAKSLLLARWSQLRTMGWDELRTRGRQELLKRWDEALYRLGVPFLGNDVGCADNGGAGFFFTPDELPRVTGLVRERLPEEAERIVQQAERICRHRFDLLGYRDLDYGPEIDWHRDVVHGKRAPLKPWFRIRFLDSAEVGDVKIPWELNRHQHFVTLAKAYCLTKEVRFAEEVFRQWYHWHRENPYPIGINWASSLEVAFRSLSWLWMRHLLAGCPAIPKPFQADLQQVLALNGRHIERYLSTYFSRNTHLLGEGVALLFIGTLCPQLRSAPRWQKLGWEIVVEEAKRQVQADGMHFEQSSYYHVYALDFLLHARVLAARNEIAIPSDFDRTLEKMLEALCALTRAGPVPRLGDDDGGRVFDPSRNRAEHLLDPLATGAVLFSRPDFKAVSGGLREETLWLLGEQGASRFDRLPAGGRLKNSTQLESSGLYVMAGSGPAGRQQLVIVAGGPQGSRGTAGHSHADALSVYLSVNGQEWLIDPGTFTYVSDRDERNYMRSTAAHNTVQVDGCPQAEPAGTFAWHFLPDVRVEDWVAGDSFDFFAGSHTGYSRLQEPVVHRRQVFYLKPRFWLVLDSFAGKGQHQLELLWHLAPHFHQSSAASGATLVTIAEGEGLAFLQEGGRGWRQEFCEGWWSPVYGRKEPSPVLRFMTKSALPLHFATLLLPVTESTPTLGTLARLDAEAKGAAVVGYCYETSRESYYMFFAERAQRWELGRWASDARFVYWGRSGQDAEDHLILCGGSYFELDGRRVFACERPVLRFERAGSGAAVQVSCSDEDVIGRAAQASVVEEAPALSADPTGYLHGEAS